MRFQLLSNLWNHYPTGFAPQTRNLILCGNIGRLSEHQSFETAKLINELSQGFKQVYWIPGYAETHTQCGRPIDMQCVLDFCNTFTRANILCNNVQTIGDKTLVASLGQTVEDLEFMHENCNSMDSVLLTPTSVVSKKARWIISGQPNGTNVNLNFTLRNQSHQIVTNSATDKGFHPNIVFELY